MEAIVATEASKGERTRSSLVTAAVTRFANEGFRRTSLADIARDVGITPAAVYRYFPDKEALFIAAVAADAAALIDLVRSSFFDQLGTSFQTAGPRVARRFMAAIGDHPLVARVLRGGEPMSPDRIHALPHLSALRAEVETLLGVGQQAGIVRQDVDVSQMALGLETIILYQLAHLATLDKPDLRKENARWTAVAAVLEAALLPGTAP